MSMRSIVTASLIVLATVSALPAMSAIGSARPGAAAEPFTPKRMVRLTLSNGGSLTVPLDGVGCPASICSRRVMDTRASGEPGITSTELDTLSAIGDVRDGGAEFIFRDGTTQRRSIVPWNQTLYVDGSAGSKRIDLAQVSRVEFVD